MTFRFLLVGLVAVAAGLFAEPASGCAVCFGEPDSAMTQGINKGILVLLGVVAAVQVFFVAVFFSIRQRTRRLEERKSRFHVVRRGAN